MSQIRVGVVGGTGYTGGVAARIVACHPDLELAFCTSDKLAGKPIADHLLVPVRSSASGAAFAPNGAALELADTCDAVLLATSAEVSAVLGPALDERGKAVVDLSGAFRLETPADYTRWYGLEHPAPAWLARAHYGLPEIFGAPPSAGDRPLVSNPGCYATAAILALAPLVRAGLVEPAGLIVDGKSGVTGAGRQAKEEYSFSEADEDVRAYKLLAHQHTPEMARALTRVAQGAAKIGLTFTAHLVPLRRGLSVTCYARPRADATPARVAECVADAYAKTPFVRAVSPAEVTLKSVVGTNHARVGATANDDVVVTVCAIDNLLKSAAGQAVQNVNLLFGLAETRGLDHLMRVMP